MCNVGDTITALKDGRPVTITVSYILVIPFGATLPADWMDATTAQDEKNGLRIGVK